MHWTEWPMCAADTETTGVDVFTDKIVTACAISINGSEVTPRTWLADPGIEIPAEASAVHGVTTEHARQHGRPLAEVVPEIVEALYTAWENDRIVVIYNAAFDISLIANHHPGFEVRGLIFDPMTVDRELDKYRPGKRTLEAVCGHYGVRLEGAHTSDGDALAAARLAWKMIRKYPMFQLTSPASMMETQADWYRARQLDFAEYLRRKGGNYGAVNLEWPIQKRRAVAA